VDFNRLISEAIGAQDLIFNDYKFHKNNQELHLNATLPFKKAICSKCNCELYQFHQWHSKTIRLPQMFMAQVVYLNLKFPRGKCYFCERVMPPQLSFVHPIFKTLSCSFVEKAGRIMEETTCAATARLLKIDRKHLWKIDQWRMKYLNQFLALPEDLDVSKMSADEVHFLTKRYKKREGPFSPKYYIQYITSPVCTAHSKVLSTAMGRSSVSLAKCLNVLSEEKLQEIQFFAIDMHQEFFNTVKRKCHNAEIAVDRFHLIQSLMETFNKLRIDEFKKAKKKKDEFQIGMLTAKRRFILMEKSPVLSTEEDNMLGKLKMLNTNINAGMLIVDYFHRVLDQKNYSKFQSMLKEWFGIVKTAKLDLFDKFAKKVQKYKTNIEAYIKSDLTTAISEGLNNKIKVVKRVGYNYRNPESFQNKILQRCGFLNSADIDCDFLFWHVPNPQV